MNDADKYAVELDYDRAVRLVEAALETQLMWRSSRRFIEDLELALGILRGITPLDPVPGGPRESP